MSATRMAAFRRIWLRRSLPHSNGLGVERWRLFAIVFLVYLVYAVIDLWKQPVPARVLGCVLIVAFVTLYVVGVPRAMNSRQPRDGYAVLAGMLAITGVYLAFCGEGGVAFGSYLTVSLVILTPLAVSVPTVLGFAAFTLFVPEHVPSWHAHGLQWSAASAITFTAIIVLVMRSNWRTHVELHQAREEVARLAADQERLRIARDLHDLLGHTLTTVIVKSELAARLAPRDAERAAAEMAEVTALARQGLTDVRAAVAGYREMSLAGELATAKEVLRAAGIEADLPGAVDAVPADLRELFAWTVREGVTNAVRHSRARTLRVALSPRSVEVVDDGIGPVAGPAAGDGGRTGGGSGLAGLAERAAALGGRVLSGPAPAGAGAAGAGAAGAAGAGGEPGYRLRVEVPA